MRQDGRINEKLRKVTITRDYNRYAEGSCLIELGQTRVICTASVEETVPPFLKGSGRGWITAEYGMLPRSCKSRLLREKSSGRTFEIQRLIGRSLRAVASLEDLGERTIIVDCDVLQADGGTRTASITGGFVALADCLFRLKKNALIRTLPVVDFVAATSVGIVEGRELLDLTFEEDSQAQVDMNVVMTGKGRFVEIQGTGEHATFTQEQMGKLISLAQAGIEELVKIQRQALKDTGGELIGP